LFDERSHGGIWLSSLAGSLYVLFVHSLFYSSLNRRQFGEAAALGAATLFISRNVFETANFPMILGEKFRIWDAHCHLAPMG
jgi:hypothetical protein